MNKHKRLKRAWDLAHTVCHNFYHEDHPIDGHPQSLRFSNMTEKEVPKKGTMLWYGTLREAIVSDKLLSKHIQTAFLVDSEGAFVIAADISMDHYSENYTND